MELDGIKLTLGGADTAANTLVGIHDAGTAAKAASRFRANLLFGEGQLGFPEGLFMVDVASLPGNLAGRVIVLLYADILLIQLDELTAVAANGQAEWGCTKRWMEMAPSRPAAMASMANLGPV